MLGHNLGFRLSNKEFSVICNAVTPISRHSAMEAVEPTKIEIFLFFNEFANLYLYFFKISLIFFQVLDVFLSKF